MHQRRPRGGVVEGQGLVIEPMLENGGDMAIRPGARHARAVAGGIQSLGAVLLREA